MFEVSGTKEEAIKVKCEQCGKENEAFEGGGVGIKCARRNIAGVTVPRVLKWARKPRRVNRADGNRKWREWQGVN